MPNPACAEAPETLVTVGTKDVRAGSATAIIKVVDLPRRRLSFGIVVKVLVPLLAPSTVTALEPGETLIESGA